LKDNSNINNVIFFFKKHTKCQFYVLSDILGIDKLLLKNNNLEFLEKKFIDINSRFSIYYVLLSLRYNCRIIIELELNMLEKVKTLNFIFNSAGWLEREIWDLFGISFLNNKDLRRILTDYGFEGHALRKDFPLSGFIEIRYDDSLKRIVYEPLEITQEYRLFDFRSPWFQFENNK
jgi:NADH:ubiquinone oxidoreductase subunit C